MLRHPPTPALTCIPLQVMRAELPGWLATLQKQAAWPPHELRLWSTLSGAQRARLQAAGVFSPSELLDPQAS